MSETARHDAWQAGDSYEAYMGRWSRPIAGRFLDWLSVPARSDWIELGCGTGALTSAIRARDPASVIAVDPSEGFIARARRDNDDPRIAFEVGDVARLASLAHSGCDVAVSGLVLNFIPDRAGALAQLKRLTRTNGTVAFYVWDYPGGGLEFLDAFWQAAAAIDPAAAALSEDRRFPFCTEAEMAELAREAGLDAVESNAIVVPSVFRDFDDYWFPFTLGAGPAPGYCGSLAPDARQRLKDALSSSLPRQGDGAIALAARAWAVKGRVA